MIDQKTRHYILKRMDTLLTCKEDDYDVVKFFNSYEELALLLLRMDFFNDYQYYLVLSYWFDNVTTPNRVYHAFAGQ